MFIRSFIFPKKALISILILIIFLTPCLIIYFSYGLENNNSSEIQEEENNDEKDDKNFIRWVDFNVTSDVLNKTANLDIKSHQDNEKIKYNWIELLAYLACKNGGNFKNFKSSTLDDLISKLKNGEKMEDLTANMKFYNYYYESYSAVLNGFIGNYSIETKNEENEKVYEEKYGLKAFLPIAKNYNFSHYDDFGNSRSYGFKRVHLGNDLMGSIGTPIIAVESGVIEHLGWNQYGGWRVGIRSFDTKRYYYYAHLRKNHPYSEGLQEGMTVKAGDVIAAVGSTGNSTGPHLHLEIRMNGNTINPQKYLYK